MMVLAGEQCVDAEQRPAAHLVPSRPESLYVFRKTSTTPTAAAASILHPSIHPASGKQKSPGNSHYYWIVKWDPSGEIEEKGSVEQVEHSLQTKSAMFPLQLPHFFHSVCIFSAICV